MLMKIDASINWEKTWPGPKLQSASSHVRRYLLRLMPSLWNMTCQLKENTTSRLCSNSYSTISGPPWTRNYQLLFLLISLLTNQASGSWKGLGLWSLKRDLGSQMPKSDNYKKKKKNPAFEMLLFMGNNYLLVWQTGSYLANLEAF